MTKIGIIAGDGNLPLYIGKSLLSKNYDVTFLSLNNKNNKFYNNHHVVDLDILSVKKIFKVLDSNKRFLASNNVGKSKPKSLIPGLFILPANIICFILFDSNTLKIFFTDKISKSTT